VVFQKLICSWRIPSVPVSFILTFSFPVRVGGGVSGSSERFYQPLLDSLRIRSPNDFACGSLPVTLLSHVSDEIYRHRLLALLPPTPQVCFSFHPNLPFRKHSLLPLFLYLPRASSSPPRRYVKDNPIVN